MNSNPKFWIRYIQNFEFQIEYPSDHIIILSSIIVRIIIELYVANMSQLNISTLHSFYHIKKNQCHVLRVRCHQLRFKRFFHL